MNADELFHQNMPWAERLAKKYHAKLPPSFDLEDMLQIAYLEMHRQIGKWDPAKNNNFQGFAYQAVLGSMRMATRRRHWKNATSEDMAAPEVSAVVRQQSEDRSESATEAQREAWREQWRKATIGRRLRKVGGPDADLARLVLVEGKTIQEAATVTGYDEAKAGRVIRSMVPKLKGKAGRPRKAAGKLLGMLRAGMTRSEMAAGMGVTERRVYQRIAEMKARGIIRFRQSLFGPVLETKEKEQFVSGATA